MDRRRLAITCGLLALAGLAGGWCERRIHAAIGIWGGIPGGPGDWLTQRMLDLGAHATTAGGLLALVVTAASAVTGALVLGWPARLERAAALVVPGLGLGVLATELACFSPDPGVLEPPSQWGIVLLSALLLAVAALVGAWTRAAWSELGRPAGSLGEEASRVLFAAGPTLIVVHLLLGTALGRLPGVGLTATRDAGAITATGGVLLGVAVLRAIRRDRAAEAG